MMQSSLFFLSALSLLSTTVYSSILKTTINAGTVQGAQCSTNNATFFKAIPYAQPPLGELRFAAPQPFQGKFNGSFLNAIAPAPACIQFGTEFLESGPWSEDCLYLDIWIPPTATPTSGLPVKVWIHGGANTAGGISDPAYDGCALAATNTLVVSINYRLGPLGFMALDTAGIQGNQAIQDIVLGLQWIQDNIATFGGNPKEVLLFGQSAGADDTFIVSTLPQARKLIKAAIAESGGGWALPPATAVQALGTQYMKALNCSVNDAACIRNIPVSVLNSTLPQATFVGIDGSPFDSFSPYVDGVFIKEQPSTVGVQVPAVFGSTSMEGTLFILALYGTKFSTLTNTEYLQFLSTQFAPSIVPLIAKQFPISLFNKTPYPAFYAMASVITDAAFKCPAYRGLTTAVKNGIPAYTYIDVHTPNCEWVPGVPAKSLKLLGAAHTADLPLVFERLTGYENGTCSLTAAEDQLSKDLVAAWTSMASTGSPSTSSLQWPQFSLDKSQGTVINQTMAAGTVDYSVCEFWDKIDTLSLKLWTESWSGNFSANGTSESGAPANGTGSGGSSGSNTKGGGTGPSSKGPTSGGVTTSPIAFTGAAFKSMAGGIMSLVGLVAAVMLM